MSQGAFRPIGGAAGRANAAAGPDALPATRTWRIQLDGLPRPFPLLRTLTIGSDERAGLQLAHGSIRPFHVRLTIRGENVFLEAIDGAPVKVGGVRVERALLSGDERIQIGEIHLGLEPVAPGPVTVFSQASGLGFAEEFRHVLVRELKRLQWLTISVGVHAVVLYFAAQQQLATRETPIPARVSIAITERAPAVDVNEAEELAAVPSDPDPPIEAPPEIDVPEPLDPIRSDLPESNDPPIDLMHRAGIGVGRSGDRYGGRGGDGFGGPGVDLARAGGQLGQRLQDLRTRGVDLVFLVDTTASMDPFLAQAKRTVDRIIDDLASLVPSLRLGIIAFRDEGDEYVTRAVPLSNDRFAILNFLETLEARGGGDVPEAERAAIDFAIDETNWRTNSHRILIVIGDAPPHPEEEARLKQRLHTAAFSKPPTLTSAIFTGAGQFSLDRQEDAERSLKAIATAGGGEYATLENDERIVAQMVSIAFGTQSRATIERLLADRQVSPKAALVASRVQSRDLDWMFQKLTRIPIEPAVVEGLVEIGGPQVVMRSWRIVNDDSAPAPTREAALYVLRRITRFEGSIDFAKPLEVQESAVGRLQQAVETSFRPGRRRDGHRRKSAR